MKQANINNADTRRLPRTDLLAAQSLLICLHGVLCDIRHELLRGERDHLDAVDGCVYT